VQRQPFTVYPQFIVHSGMSRFDDTDALCANVAAAMKAHNDEFENEDQLKGWLDEAGITYDERLGHGFRTVGKRGQIEASPSGSPA
jgi:hypothetical protein